MIAQFNLLTKSKIAFIDNLLHIRNRTIDTFNVVIDFIENLIFHFQYEYYQQIRHVLKTRIQSMKKFFAN